MHIENYKRTTQISQYMGPKMGDTDIIKYSLLPNTVAFGEGGGKGKKGYRNGKVRKERENNWKYIYFCKKYIEWFLFFYIL